MAHLPEKLFFFKDSRFHMGQSSAYHLAIGIGSTTCKVCCVDPITKQCLFLGVYRLAEGSVKQQISLLEQLYSTYPVFASGKQLRVTLCIENQKYTCIPTSLFQADKVGDYLRLACPIQTEEVHYFVHTGFNVVVAFGVEPLLLHWFQKTYATATLYTIHQASSLITGIHCLQVDNGRVPRLFVWVEPRYLHITVLYQDHLLYYNRFRYSNSDEFLYYILAVMNVLHFEPSLHEVIVGGSIHKKEVMYQKACHYIRRIVFIPKPPFLTLRYRFFNPLKESMVAKYFDILSAHLCHG